MNWKIILAVLVCVLIIILFYIAIKRAFNHHPEPPPPQYASTPNFDHFDPFQGVDLMELYGDDDESDSEILEELYAFEQDENESEETEVVEPTTTVPRIRRTRVVMDGHGFRIIGNVIQIVTEGEVEVEEPAERDRENETPEEFFDRIAEHNDDGQNVHNPSIRKILTNKLLRIIELNEISEPTKEEYSIGGETMTKEQYLEARTIQVSHEIKQRARQYFDGLILREEMTTDESNIRMDKIGLVLDKVARGYDIAMKDGKIYKEDFILNHVWNRINSSDNEDHRTELQIALIDNLVDGVQKKHGIQAPVVQNFIANLIGQPPVPADGIAQTYEPVCINGRVARYITSLILIDADDEIAAPEKDEKEIANEAYMKASRILDREIERYEMKLPECNKTMEDIYTELDPEKNLSQREKLILEGFEKHVKNTIREELTKDYDNIVDSDILESIIAKAQAGVS